MVGNPPEREFSLRATTEIAVVLEEAVQQIFLKIHLKLWKKREKEPDQEMLKISTEIHETRCKQLTNRKILH